MIVVAAIETSEMVGMSRVIGAPRDDQVSDHCARQQLCAGAIDGLSRNSVKLEGSQERLILRLRGAGNGMQAEQFQRAAQGAKKPDARAAGGWCSAQSRWCLLTPNTDDMLAADVGEGGTPHQCHGDLELVAQQA